MRLADKVAMITGAAQGIGRATALLFASEGADVVIPDVNVEGAQAVAKEVLALGRRALAVQCDVSDPAQVSAAVQQAVATLGGIDVLVNNAAAASYAPFLDTDLDDWNRILRVCLTGYFVVGQAVAREMVHRERGGKIVNIASIAGVVGNAYSSAYGAAKGGVIALTKVMAVELAGHRINVNAIAPGPILTPLVAQLLDEEGIRSRAARMPLGRLGKPEEIANACLFLASDEAEFVTAHVLHVDGGWFGAGILPHK